MKLATGTALRVLLAFSPARIVPVGRLALDRGRAALEYDPTFTTSGLTINPHLGLPGRELVWAAQPRLFQGLHGVFADSLPDAWGRELMRRRAIARGVDPTTLTALDHLAIVGRRGMGALAYEPAVPPDDVDEIDLDVLSREALDVLAGRETADALTTLEELGDSSGGARPKILVAIDAAGNLRAGTDAVPHEHRNSRARRTTQPQYGDDERRHRRGHRRRRAFRSNRGTLRYLCFVTQGDNRRPEPSCARAAGHNIRETAFAFVKSSGRLHGRNDGHVPPCRCR